MIEEPIECPECGEEDLICLHSGQDEVRYECKWCGKEFTVPISEDEEEPA